MWETEWVNLNSWTLQWAILKLTVNTKKKKIEILYLSFVYQCSLPEEKDRAQKGIKKSKEILKETEFKVEVEQEKIRKVETENEKYSVDHRTLESYRDELTELLDSVSYDIYKHIFGKF